MASLNGHAVQIATGAEFGRVEVSVCIKPEYAEFLALRFAMLRYRTDRANGHTVVAA